MVKISQWKCWYTCQGRPDTSRRQRRQLPPLPPGPLPWCTVKSPDRNLQIPHRGALYQGTIALPLQVQSIRPACKVYLHINSQTQSNLMCSKLHLHVKMSEPFLTGKHCLILFRVVKITVKTSQKLPLCEHLGQQSKTVSWLVLTAIATWHERSAIVGGLICNVSSLHH